MVPEILHATPAERFICEQMTFIASMRKFRSFPSLSYEEIIDLSVKLSSVKERFDRNKIREELMEVFQK